MMDLPSAFCFVVCFGTDATDVDASFQEVGGIGAELEIEAVQEGGENRYVHQLPKGVKHLRLTLKRGLVPIDCRQQKAQGVGGRLAQIKLAVANKTMAQGRFAEMCQRWQQRQRTHHVPQEHKHQQDTHVFLELNF